MPGLPHRAEATLRDAFARRRCICLLRARGPAQDPLRAKMGRDSAGCPAQRVGRDPVTSGRLRPGWVKRDPVWNCLIDRHPKLASAGSLSNVGEAIDHESRPAGQASELLERVDGGIRLPLPWLTGALDLDWSENDFELLADLRRDADGWTFHDDETDRCVFRAEAEIAAVRTEDRA